MAGRESSVPTAPSMGERSFFAWRCPKPLARGLSLRGAASDATAASGRRFSTMNVARLAAASLHRRLIVVERDSAAFFLRLRRLLVDIELERRDSLDLALADGADYVLL